MHARWATTWRARLTSDGTGGSSAALPAVPASTRTPTSAGRVYLRSVLAFSLVSVLFLYGLPAGAGTCCRSPSASPAVEPAPAWNTAASFVTNTNWQSYSGESTMGHLVQMAGLAVQNFVSAAVGIAVAVALVRGFARSRTDRLGNFWVDLARGMHPDPAAARRRRRRAS